MNTPWKTDKWFVSLWNYLDGIREGLSLPHRVLFHDTTLRDGEQQAGIIYTKNDKIAIAEKLAEVGIHRIEAGLPVVSPQDEAAIREIVKRNLGPEIFSFARCMPDDVKRAADCGVDGVVVEIPTSQHMIQTAYRWPLEKVLDSAIRTTALAKELGLKTAFFPIDASRAEISWFLELVKKIATEGHMDSLVVVDSFGVTSPHVVPFLMKEIKKVVDKPLEAHFHNDFGLATANTVMAVAAGAEVVHVTVGGTGERAGNASLEEVATILLTMYGIDAGLKTEKFCELAQLVRKLGNVPIQPSKPIIGDGIFNIESGIVAMFLVNCGMADVLELFPFHWTLVGNHEPEVVIGKKSGKDSVKLRLDKLSQNLTDEQILKAVDLIKHRAFAKKALLTDDEFEEILEEVRSL